MALSEILHQVSARVGASLELQSAEGEPVFGRFGPGKTRDVLTSMLHGSHFNYLVSGSLGHPGPMRIMLFPIMAEKKVDKSAVQSAEAGRIPAVSTGVNRGILETTSTDKAEGSVLFPMRLDSKQQRTPQNSKGDIIQGAMNSLPDVLSNSSLDDAELQAYVSSMRDAISSANTDGQTSQASSQTLAELVHRRRRR